MYIEQVSVDISKDSTRIVITNFESFEILMPTVVGSFTFGTKIYWPLCFWAIDILAKDISAKDISAKVMFWSSYYKSDISSKDFSAKKFFFDFLEKIAIKKSLAKYVTFLINLAKSLTEMSLWSKCL